MKLRTGKEQEMNVCGVYHVWIIMDCRCAIKEPVAGTSLPMVKKTEWPNFRQFRKKAVSVMARLIMAAAVTSLYVEWSVERAFLHRGYKAYGGEYIIIPLVFYAAYRILGMVSGLLRRIRGRVS